MAEIQRQVDGGEKLAVQHVAIHRAFGAEDEQALGVRLHQKANLHAGHGIAVAAVLKAKAPAQVDAGHEFGLPDAAEQRAPVKNSFLHEMLGRVELLVHDFVGGQVGHARSGIGPVVADVVGHEQANGGPHAQQAIDLHPGIGGFAEKNALNAHRWPQHEGVVGFAGHVGSPRLRRFPVFFAVFQHHALQAPEAQQAVVEQARRPDGNPSQQAALVVEVDAKHEFFLVRLLVGRSRAHGRGSGLQGRLGPCPSSEQQASGQQAKKTTG